MKEYDQSGAAFYDYHYTGLEGDVEFYVAEAVASGSPVLEIGCGTGRILIPVAEAGITMIGLDHTPAMLAVARRKIAQTSPETQRRIELVEGDMREFALPQRFRLIMIPYRAFLHLLTPADQRRALCCIREHLAEDGRLIFNVFDPDLDEIAAHIAPLGTALKKTCEFNHPDTGHRVILWDTRQYDPEGQRVNKYNIFEELDDDGTVLSKTYSPLTLRYVYRYEMQYLLELCGYQVQTLYGDFSRGPFRYGREQIWVACKS